MSVPHSKASDARTALVSGPYVPPVVRLGEWLNDEVHGPAEVGGYSSGPIPWPHRLKTGRVSLILCGDLVRAVRTESASAVAHHFGVSTAKVSKWRVALGVDRKNNQGTVALRRIMYRGRGASRAKLPRAASLPAPDGSGPGEVPLATPRPEFKRAMTVAERKKQLRERKVERGERRTSVDLSDEARERADRAAAAAGVSRTQWINDLIVGAAHDGPVIVKGGSTTTP